jgi:hypothetical protein
MPAMIQNRETPWVGGFCWSHGGQQRGLRAFLVHPGHGLDQ